MESYFSLKNSEILNFTKIGVDASVRKKNLQRYGGVEGVCKKLRTNPNTGLSTLDLNDLQNRETFYERNELLKKAGKSFLGYIWMAMHDNLLIVLIICALISIGLPFVDQSDSCVCLDTLNKTIQGKSNTIHFKKIK